MLSKYGLVKRRHHQLYYSMYKQICLIMFCGFGYGSSHLVPQSDVVQDFKKAAHVWAELLHLSTLNCNSSPAQEVSIPCVFSPVIPSGKLVN